MNIVRALRNLGAKDIWQVFLLALWHPLFVLPTLFATKKCITLSTQYFGKAHHENGPANAFRHALWNYIIARSCSRWSTKMDKAVVWAKKITDWHEEAFVNSPLARAMDLHNNKVGRYLFSKYGETSLEELVDMLVDMTKESILVETENEIDAISMHLVHIIDTQ
ncbi:DUF6973 domain-containing protein [Flagellimonas sp.]|uniref:DUF6973 domain-containing protein n=1 Tax=Flagellimonas sp. TaxID=2058762 RepID=UPI003F49B45C